MGRHREHTVVRETGFAALLTLGRSDEVERRQRAASRDAYAAGEETAVGPELGSQLQVGDWEIHDTRGMNRYRCALLRFWRVREGGVRATWDDVITHLLCGSAEGRSLWNLALEKCSFTEFYWELPPLCLYTSGDPFEMCAIEAPSSLVQKWSKRLDRSTFEEVCRGRGSSKARIFLGHLKLHLYPGDIGADESSEFNPVSACKHIGSFVRQAHPTQQQEYWQEFGELLLPRAKQENPTFVYTDGSEVFWLHTHISYEPNYKYWQYSALDCLRDPASAEVEAWAFRCHQGPKGEVTGVVPQSDMGRRQEHDAIEAMRAIANDASVQAKNLKVLWSLCADKDVMSAIEAVGGIEYIVEAMKMHEDDSCV